MWRRILAFVLFGLGLLSMIFFRRYTGVVIPFPFFFFILGVAMFFSGFLFLRYTPTATDIKIQKQIVKAILDLKQHGYKIQVDLSQCEIKEHNYREQRERSDYSDELLALDFERKIQDWNSMSRSWVPDVEHVNVNQTVIIYNHHHELSGKVEKFVSRIILKDKLTLLFYFDRQKYTTLYVDKKNRNKYYFDLEFLDS